MFHLTKFASVVLGHKDPLDFFLPDALSHKPGSTSSSHTKRQKKNVDKLQNKHTQLITEGNVSWLTPEQSGRLCKAYHSLETVFLRGNTVIDQHTPGALSLDWFHRHIGLTREAFAVVSLQLNEGK